MSEDAIREANRFADEFNDGFVAPTGSYDQHGYVDKLQTAIVNFKWAKAQSNQSLTLEKALEIIQYRTFCIGDGLIAETEKSLNFMNFYKSQSEKKTEEIKRLRKEHDDKIKEMQSVIDGLYEQVGIAKGLYQECSRRIEQMINQAGMKP